MKNALIISVSALALAACGGESTTDGGTQITQVDEATASSALEALHLASSGDGAVSWDSRTFDDGIYTFTGVSFEFPEDENDDDADDDGVVKNDETGEAEMSDDETNTVDAETMVLAGPRFDAEGNVIFDQLSIVGIGISDSDDEVSGTIARFVVESPNAIMAAAIADGFSGEDVDDDDINEDDWTYGLLAIEGLSISGSDDGDTFTAALDLLSLSDVAQHSIGRFELSNLAIEGTDDEIGIINIRLDEMSADGIGEALTYPFAAQFAMMNAVLDDDTPNEDITAEMPEVPEDFDPLNAYEHAAIRGLDVNVGGVTVTMESLTADVENDGNELRYASTMTPLIIAPDTNYPLGAQMAMGLGMLGYQQLEIVSGGASVYERDADRAYTTEENYLELREGFRVEVESDVSGLIAYSMAALEMGYTMDEPDPEQIFAMLEPLVLNSFVFRLEDMSLLDRALTAASAAQGMPKEQLRQQAGAMITLGTMAAPAEIPRALVTQFSTAMSSFIANGGTMEFRVEPETPVSVGEIISQAEAGTVDVEAMGISVTAIAPENED
jgi:hypothetical protein